MLLCFQIRVNFTLVLCIACYHFEFGIADPTLIDAELKQSRKPKKFPKKASKDAISIRQCQNCFHEEPVYPFIPAPVSYSISADYYSSSDTSSSSSSSYDSYDYGSSSSSSSDFGGGGSDGGGAGGDW
jgi:uncharacterized protein